jgi:hypothetical protein
MYVGNFEMLAKRTEIFKNGDPNSSIEIKGKTIDDNSISIGGSCTGGNSINIGCNVNSGENQISIGNIDQNSITLGPLKFVIDSDYLNISNLNNLDFKTFRIKWEK